MARITTSSSAAAMSTAAVGDSPKMVVRSTTVERGSAEAPSSLFVVVELERSVLTVPDALVPGAGAGDGSFVAGADGKLEDEDEPWASTSATGAAIRAAPSRAACKNFIPHLLGGIDSKAGATERAEVGRGRRMSTWETLPAQFNVATWFVDRNVADGRGAAPAFHYEDRILTYADVQDLANRSGNALRELGVQMEDRVLVLCLDAPEFLGAFWGAIKIGAVPIPVNTLMRSADFLHFLNDSRARAVVVSASLLREVEPILGDAPHLEQVIVGGGDARGHLAFEDLVSRASPGLSNAPTSRNDAAFWLY